MPYDSAHYVNYRNSAGDEIRLVVKNSEPTIVDDQYVEYNVNATGDTITTRYLFTMQHKSIVINNTRFHKQFHLEIYTHVNQQRPENGEAIDVLRISFSDNYNELSYTSNLVFRDAIADEVEFVVDLYDLTMLDKVKFGEHEYVDVILSKKDRSGEGLYFSYEIGIIAFRDEVDTFGLWMKSIK
ncbi:MAG: hypothetical protein OEM26_01115 [Saprospiraceae bacterium]|nr:hypothetical protein [Saprospiraceae bacterium]